MATGQVSPKRGKIVDIPNEPTIGTATAGTLSATVGFTADSSGKGGPVFSYRAVSNPGSVVGTGTTSPISVTGLTAGTSYTFTVAAVNPSGYSPYTSASNSVTPTDPASFVSIATATPTSGGTVTFNSIPSGYQDLQIRGIVFNDSAAVLLQFNGDTNSNYVRNKFNGTNTSKIVSNQTSMSDIQLTGMSQNPSSTYGVSFIANVADYSSTSKYKTVRAQAGLYNGTTGEVNLMGGLWLNTNAITSITVYHGGTYSSGTKIALYGIKGS